jgi:hypothetical protein
MQDDINAFGRRPGLQLCLGPAAETTVHAAGADVAFEMVITKGASLGYLHISPEVAGLDPISVVIQADGITNGTTPNEIWNAGSFGSPGFGHRVQPQTKVIVTVRNNTGAPIANTIACYTYVDENKTLPTIMDLRQSTAPNAGSLNLD